MEHCGSALGLVDRERIQPRCLLTGVDHGSQPLEYVEQRRLAPVLVLDRVGQVALESNVGLRQRRSERVKHARGESNDTWFGAGVARSVSVHCES